MATYNITLQSTWTAIQTAILTVSMLFLSSMPLSAQTDSDNTIATSNQNVRSTAADRHIKIGQHTYRIPLDLLRTRLEGTNVDSLQLVIPFDYIGLKIGSASRPEKYSIENSAPIYLYTKESHPWVPARVGMDKMVDVYGSYTLEPTDYPGMQLVNYQKRAEAKVDSPLIYFGQSRDDSVEVHCDNYKPAGPPTSQCNYSFSFEDLIVHVYFMRSYLPKLIHIHEGIIQRLKALQES